jgi:hypothetical protein
MSSNEILKLAQQGKMPDEIAEELMISENHVYRYTPGSWYADPKADEEALEKPPLSLEVSYYSQQQADAGGTGYANEEQRLLRNLKKCWLKSFKEYHGAKMDLF